MTKPVGDVPLSASTSVNMAERWGQSMTVQSSRRSFLGAALLNPARGTRPNATLSEKLQLGRSGVGAHLISSFSFQAGERKS